MFLICFAIDAYRSVLSVSYELPADGDTQAIINVFAFPLEKNKESSDVNLHFHLDPIMYTYSLVYPRLSFRRSVSLEFL